MHYITSGTDAPEQTRFGVKFNNWSQHGLVIAPQKLATDAGNFRLAAKTLRKMQGREAEMCATCLENMAEQWEAIAAAGED